MNNPILVESTRGNIRESFHRGVVCIVDSENKVLYSAGDVQQVCYPRSALKFFQQIPLLTSGAVEQFGFTNKEIAIMCGSHNGEEAHVETARGILAKIGLTEDALLCGAQMPTLREDQAVLIKNDIQPMKIHNNCSGKHAGFLAYCVFKGWPTENYIEPSHPLHQEILDIISLFHQYPKEKINTGVDGCSAPIFSFPVYNQAVAYRYLMNPHDLGAEIAKACELMVNSIVEYPEMIAGSKRYCTDLMKHSKGNLIGKTGADGIYSIGVKEPNLGICIKIDDGKMGPQYNVAQAVLEQLGLLDADSIQALHCYLEFENKNFGGICTGETKMCDDFSVKRA